MDRRELTANISGVLTKAGFAVAGQEPLPSVSFDIVARRDGDLMMVKVLTEVGSFGRVNARELRLISELIGAAPVIIGTHRGGRKLDDGIAYLRYGIPMLTPVTIGNHLLEGQPPLVFSAPGGLFVRLDGEKLAALRRSREMSRGSLASMLGVSSRAVRMYEEGMAARVEVAVRLEEFSSEPLVRPLDIMSVSDGAKAAREESEGIDEVDEEVFAHLDLLGYEVITTPHCPFDAVARKDRGFFAGLDGSGGLREKARAMADLARLSDYYSVIFMKDGKGKECIEGTPVITRAELRRIDSPEDILELIEERGK